MVVLSVAASAFTVGSINPDNNKVKPTSNTTNNVVGYNSVNITEPLSFYNSYGMISDIYII